MDFPSIALLTDFGERDGFVGVMKGVMLTRLAQPVPLVDISHQIAPQNIRQGMWVLENAYPYFPPKTVFLAVVDPGVGSQAQASLLAYWPQRQQLFIAPDNGLLSSIYEAAGDELEMYDIRQSRLYQEDSLSLHGRSQTFHGRDVYAPIAALAANALLTGEMTQFLAQLGRLNNSAVFIQRPKPSHIEEGKQVIMQGEIIASDHFGNLITNIPNDWVPPEQFLTLQISPQSAIPCLCQEAYSAPHEIFPGHEAIILVPSSGGTLEVAIYEGNAQKALSAMPGIPITLQFAR